jgi:hypothetical protein
MLTAEQMRVENPPDNVISVVSEPVASIDCTARGADVKLACAVET